MKLDMHIRIPDVPGLITRKKIRGHIYIHYEYDSTYDRGKRITYPKRVSIGKLDADGLMVPNANFRKYLPGVHLPGERRVGSVSGCLRMGAFFIIGKIISDCGIREKLSPFFKPKEVGLLLDLSVYSIISEDNAAQYYPDYTFNHPVFTHGMRRYTDYTVSSFLGGVAFDQTAGFLNKWNEGRSRGEKIYISYDSTNKNCQAGDLEIVEFGKAKDDARLPLFNYSLAFDQGNEEPLFYEEYPGSIVDVSQLKHMLDKAEGYGYRDIGFILDRGYFSKDNIACMDRLGYGFVMMVKGRRSLVSSLVDSVAGTFERDRRRFIRRHRGYATTVKAKLYPEDAAERHFHICYSVERECREHAAVEEKIEKLARHLEKQENKEAVFPDAVGHYFELAYDSRGKVFLGARERTDVVSRELELCGYYAIVTSEDKTAEEALALYKGRDSSEKLFRGDKSYLGNHSLRVCSDESASAKIFIEFIALIVRNKLYGYLKNAKPRNERKANCMTVPAAIRKLEKIEMMRRGDDRYSLCHAVTATQKEILGAFGLDEHFITENARLLGEEIRTLEQEAIDNDEAKES